MRTRKHNWFDSIARRRVFGVQVFHDGKWKNAAINGKPIWCDTPEDRDNERARFKRLLREQARTTIPEGK